MCNSCECENIEKCSVRGNAPIGWCCPQCINYNPLNIPCANQFEICKTREFLILKDMFLIGKAL